MRRTAFERAVVKDQNVEDISAFVPAEGELTIWTKGGVPQWAWFCCPCGCGVPISANLNPTRANMPCWTAIDHGDGTYSISPSINCLYGCRSHFFVRANQIDWC